MYSEKREVNYGFDETKGIFGSKWIKAGFFTSTSTRFEYYPFSLDSYIVIYNLIGNKPDLITTALSSRPHRQTIRNLHFYEENGLPREPVEFFKTRLFCAIKFRN